MSDYTPGERAIDLVQQLRTAPRLNIARIIRESKRQAWDDGYNAGWNDAHNGTYGTYRINRNPHS